jgi:hypothetical protein
VRGGEHHGQSSHDGRLLDAGVQDLT